MKNTFKKILEPFVPQVLLNTWRKRQDKKNFEEWKKNGCPIPTPHLVKQNTIDEYRKKYACATLVETGTYMGDMVEAQKKRFKKIVSIELGVDLFVKAKKRFSNDQNVTIVQGDSGKVLPVILKDIDEPALFWLDGHYSEGVTAKGDKECPIFEELDAIFSSKRLNHILLIDDARCYTGSGDYPTIDKLTEFIKNKNDKYQVEVKHDIIRYAI
ncbi:MAG TPA: hypothetical protein VL443_26230 [Cyclobacteriaceae bacterium]|nr:hypothetical protein [Cyclobacteriaceae bacterium]